MTDRKDLVIEPLNATHNRAAFASGNASLDTYLQRQARQDVQRRISRVFVASRPETPSIVVGFYTLSSLSISCADLPEHLAKKLPKNPLPAALIGRLAVAEHEQNSGIGKLLIANAIRRTLAVSQDIAIYAIVVDPIDNHANRYYQRLGFLPLTNANQRLYLPLRTI